MKKSEIIEAVSALAEPVCAENGCTLWDVEYVREGGEWFLRLYIDKDEGVGIDDCEAVSRAMDPLLDQADPIDTSYTFEVSSAGAERVLKRPGDFQQFLGSYVCVKLYQAQDGRKEIYGDLEAYDDGDVTVGGKKYPKGQYSQVRLAIKL